MNIKRIIISLGLFINLAAQSFSIARIHYNGGGDWYSNASSLPNLLNYLKSNTPISVHSDEVRIKLTDENLNQYSDDIYVSKKILNIVLSYTSFVNKYTWYK